VTATVNALLGELRPHVVTLVDGLAIPEAWKNAAILREEAGRQEAVHLEDVVAGARTTGDTAVTLDVPPGQ